MSSSSLQNINSETFTDIIDKAPPITHRIDTRFFSKATWKTGRLISNRGDSEIVSLKTGEWLGFEFKELVFITKVYAVGLDIPPATSATLSFDPAFGVKSKQFVEAKYNEETFVFTINAFTSGFGIKIENANEKSLPLKSLHVEGIEESALEIVASISAGIRQYVDETVNAANALIRRATEADNQHQKLALNINEVSAELSRTKIEIDDRKLELSKLEQAKSEIEEEIKQANDTLEKSHSDCEDATRSRNSILDEIKDLKNKKDRLNQDVNALNSEIQAFPSNITGYSKQGFIDVCIYCIICLIPSIIIYWITSQLFENARKFLDVQDTGDLSVYEFLLLRSPYIAVAMTVCAVCYNVLNHLINEIIQINRKKQDLLKISIIATDVSNAASANLKLSEEEKYELNAHLKIEMLKEHLRHHISSDFNYKGLNLLNNTGWTWPFLSAHPQKAASEEVPK